MKKIVCLLLVIMLVLLTGCGSDKTIERPDGSKRVILQYGLFDGHKLK